MSVCVLFVCLHLSIILFLNSFVFSFNICLDIFLPSVCMGEINLIPRAYHTFVRVIILPVSERDRTHNYYLFSTLTLDIIFILIIQYIFFKVLNHFFEKISKNWNLTFYFEMWGWKFRTIKLMSIKTTLT